MKTIARLTLAFSLLLCLAQRPGLTTASSLLDSLDSVFGKSEEFLTENYGKPESEHSEPEWKNRKSLRYEVPSDGSNTGSSSSVPVDVGIRDGVVTWVAARLYWPGHGPKDDLITSMEKIRRQSTAVGLNFLNDKVSDFGRPAVRRLGTTMIKGASDAERWALVKKYLLRLSSMNEQQVKSIFGPGSRYEDGQKKNYSNFYLYYQITPLSPIPGSNLYRGIDLDLMFMGGTVANARLEQFEGIVSR